MTPAQEALKRFKEGNNRFVERLKKTGTAIDGDGVLILPQEQKPFATILGCSDSRVPAEIVLDQGLGDLFVIRVAGNVVAPSQVGSVEYVTSQCRAAD